MDGCQMFYCFHFHDELRFYDEVHSIAALEGHALVSNRQDPLTLEA